MIAVERKNYLTDRHGLPVSNALSSASTVVLLGSLHAEQSGMELPKVLMYLRYLGQIGTHLWDTTRQHHVKPRLPQGPQRAGEA